MDLTGGRRPEWAVAAQKLVNNRVVRYIHFDIFARPIIKALPVKHVAGALLSSIRLDRTLRRSLSVQLYMALRDMIVLLGEKAGLTREDAYTLCSLAGDLRVTQTVNGCKGVHMMMAKDYAGGQDARM